MTNRVKSHWLFGSFLCVQKSWYSNMLAIEAKDRQIKLEATQVVVKLNTNHNKRQTLVKAFTLRSIVFYE